MERDGKLVGSRAEPILISEDEHDNDKQRMARAEKGSRAEPIVIADDEHNDGGQEMTRVGKGSQLKPIVVFDGEHSGDGGREEQDQVMSVTEQFPLRTSTCSFKHKAQRSTVGVNDNSQILKMPAVMDTEDNDSSVVRPYVFLSPIYRIPSELTLEIFTHSLPENAFPRTSVRLAPLQLTHVCRTWRRLAIATPRLWCQIFIGTRESVGREDCRFLVYRSELDAMALQVWMKRAKALLMSVHICYTSHENMSIMLHQPLQVITKSRGRPISLKLSMPATHSHWACHFTQQHVPNLETFEVDDTSIPTVGPVAIKFPIYLESCIAGTLSSFSVRGSIRYREYATEPFSRLRKLSIRHATIRNCLHLLRHCPILEDLTLHFYDLAGTASPSEEQVILLSRFQHFHFAHTRHSEDSGSSISASSQFGQLLDRFELPKLRGFFMSTNTMGSGRDFEYDSWDHLSRLIIRSNCSLSRLQLLSANIDTSTILKCLHLSPELRYLGIPANAELEHEMAQLFPGLDSLHTFKSWLSLE